VEELEFGLLGRAQIGTKWVFEVGFVKAVEAPEISTTAYCRRIET